MPITLDSCRFSYRRRREVCSSLDLEFPEGTTVLLGPNGAGKSTLLGLAASVLVPGAGTVRYGGIDPGQWRARKRYRRLVGWMPQQVRPVGGFTAREQVAYAGWLKGMPRSDAWRQAQAALETVGLGGLADRRASEVSGGQLRRIGLAQALVHDAEVILMDEPTAGLDPRQCERFAALVRRIGEQVHMIVSTHQVSDVLDTYSSVVVLADGAVRFRGTTAEFSHLAVPAAGGSPHASAAYAALIGEEE